MKRSVALAGLLTAAWLLVAAAAAPAAVTKDELDDLFKKLEANGQKLLAGEELPPADKVNLSKVAFDKDSVALLDGLLRAPQREAAGLYAINQLLDRLEQADADTAGKVLQTVKSLHARTRTAYRQFPQLSRAQSEALKMPAYSARMTTDAIMTRVAVLEKTRDAKVEREMPIARHNAVIYDLEKNAYRLALLADDQKEDLSVVRTMFLEERRGSALFLTIADEIMGLVKDKKRMTPDRAKRLYALVRPNVARVAMQTKKSYLHPGNPDIRRDASSTYGKQEEYAGIKCLQLLNALADAAGDKSCPRVKVPDAKDIDEAAKKAGPR